MDSPFYGSHWSYPSGHRYRYSPPAAGETSLRPTMTVPARKKVVSIPVRYVGSNQERSESAAKIQRLFRGFLVRKSVKKIAAIRRQVNEIEKRISMEETAELIRRDSKERLKINEMLMNLLLRLDSVRGVDSGVRDCRKAVIKKAIALQETVDAIVAAGDTAVYADDVSSEAESAGGLVEAGDSSGNLPAGKADIEDTSPEDVKGVTTALELTNNAQDSTSVPRSDEAEPMWEEEFQFPEVNHCDSADYEATVSSVSECADAHTESQTDSSANPEALVDRDSGDGCDSLGNQEENAMDIGGERKKDSGEGVAGDHRDGREGKEEENRRSGELLTRMVEDNEKMVGMMTELFERNAMQMRLLSSLSQRVEQLEKAFVCDRLRRTNKKRSAVGSVVDCSESTLDNKKCGTKK